MRVRWQKTALGDLREIAEHIAQENPGAARRVVAEIRRQVRVLADHPYLGHPGRVADTRELVIANYSYVVAYEVIGRTAAILAVVHTSRLWPESFREDERVGK